MSNEVITVFTPTYNRGYIINKCYDSLCRQTNNNFEWLIVDDGSTDDTESIVNEWIKENKIKIRYVKQKNSGKYIAHNRGVLECNTGIFVCVDSDDYLTDDAIEKIYKQWKYVDTDEKLAGIIAGKGYSANDVVGTRMPKGINKCSMFDLYDKYKFKGDATMIFKTSVLKDNLFPEIEGENFITEAVIYDKISRTYDMYLYDEILYICVYLPDGYSKNIDKIHRNNPKGYLLFLSQRIEFAKNQEEKQKAYAYYIAGCMTIGQTGAIKELDDKSAVRKAMPRAFKIYIKPKIKRVLVKLKIMKGI
ncbi:MAG: glycosyltransferase family 2 protein [Paraclostridium bifermentans]|uniref:glycosyltransferase family 2 protein n=1 Tax=Paraclostridium bifermentans TaxID=1490 RepID=UPI001D9BA4DD|nr:glycosyltransferase family 2 protein [Paraclostridium bifermentans]MBS6509121.1 glycosyltransferase family 2 protein [Paraclostridium bifermentans]